MILYLRISKKSGDYFPNYEGLQDKICADQRGLTVNWLHESQQTEWNRTVKIRRGRPPSLLGVAMHFRPVVT